MPINFLTTSTNTTFQTNIGRVNVFGDPPPDLMQIDWSRGNLDNKQRIELKFWIERIENKKPCPTCCR